MSEQILGGANEHPVILMVDGIAQLTVDKNAHCAFAKADTDSLGQRNAGVFFFVLNGDEKMQCCVRFPSGVTQVLATEP
jgi:hypothetical protein